MSEIKLWGWDKKPRTMLRYTKVGDIVCFELDSTGTRFGYGQIISELIAGHPFKGFDIVHDHPDDITVEEIENAKKFGDIFILDVYSTLDYKKFLQNGEWRVIGHQADFELLDSDLNSVFFAMGGKGMWKRKNLLNETVPISDEEASNYLAYGPVTGDQAKMWYLKYNK